MKRLYKMRHFLKDEVKFKKLMLLFLFSMATFSSVLAGTINFSATLSSNQLFYRPRPGSSVCGGYYGTFTSISSNTSTQYAYATQTFTVSTSGNYSITVTSSTASDPMLLIYNSFSPSSPTSNFRVGDDDSGSGLLSSISGCNNYFAAGTYTIVVTSYSSSTRSGTVYFSISGDGVTSGSVKLLPTVTTNSASSISSTGATLGGNVTNDGGATVTSRGIAYATSSNPTSGVAAGSGTGSFSQTVSGLSPGTTYYARAYATNSVGTAYGPQISFTTQSYTPPSVTTNATTSIGKTTATFNGYVNNTGGQNVTRGFQYSTSSSFSGAVTRTLSGTQATGSFSYSQTGLAGSTRYYVRAWARNDGGTTYGSSTSFYTDHTVTYLAGSNGSLSGTTTQIVDHGGTTSSVTAIPDNGYHFLRWSDYSTSNPRNDANVTSSFTRTASFSVNSFRFAVQPTNRVAGVGNTFTIEAIDNLGNRVSNSDRDISVAVKKSDGTTVQTLSGTLSNGVVTITEPTITLTGNYYLTVSDAGGGVNGTFSALNSATFVITPAAIDHFTVAGITDPHEAGETTSPTVTAYDQYDNVKYDYVGTITFSTDNVSPNTDKPTELPTNYTFVSSDQGVKTFTNGVSLKEYGSAYYVKVNDVTTTSAEGQQNDISVYTAELNYYQIKALSNTATYPSDNNVIVGSDFSVLAELYDEFGNKKLDFTGDLDITFSTTASPSPIGNTVVLPTFSEPQTFTQGEATIAGFILYNAQETPTITISETLTGSVGTTENIVVWPEELNNFLVQEAPSQNHSIGGVRVTAGTPFSIKVTARDQYNNIKRDYDGYINFKSSNDAIVDFPSDLQRFTPVNNGFRVFTDAISIPTTGSYWLRVADSPYAFKTGDLQNIIVGPGVYNSSVSELVATSTTTGLTAGDYVDVLLTPRDADGNLMCDCQNVAVFLNGEGNDWDSDPDPIPVNDNHDGTYTASVRITELGANTITATLDGVELTDQINVAVEYPAAPSLVVSTITPSPASITTDEYSEIVLQLKDEFGNNRTTDDGTITFITDLGGFGANNGSQTVEASYVGGTSGQYTVTLFASFDEVNHGVGNATISAEADFTDVNHTDGTFTETPTVTITEGLPDLTTSTISASPSSMTTDESSAITVQLKDHLGNNIQNSRGDISLAATIGALTSVSDNGDGTYSATLSGDTQGVNGTGTSVITGDFTGDESASAVAGAISDDEEVEITEGLPDVSTIDISVASAAITADDSTMVTVQLKDQFGNLIVNDRGTVKLSVSPIGVIDNGTATGAADITAVYQSNGSYTAIFKLNNSGVGTATITGSIDESAITDNALVEVSHGVATQLAMNTQPAHTTNEAIAGEAFSTQPKVEVHDQWGNIVTSDNATVVSAATGSAGTDVLQGNTSTTVSGGIATFAGLNYETAEDMNIEFTSGSLAAVTSNTLSVVHAIPDYMVITGSATQTAGIAQTITVKVFDQFGNQALRFDGDKMISFSGANNSPLPPFTPTVDDTNFGTLTTLSFTDGVATASMKLFKEETAYIEASHSDSEFSDSYTGGANLSIEAVNPNGLEVVVEQATPDYFEVTIENDLSEVTAGSQYSIFVKAFDQYNNPATNYSGDKVLVFSGAAISPSPSTSPTIEDKDGVAVNFGENVTLTFDGNGEASATMILYKAETGIQIVAEESVPGVTTGSGYELDLDVNPAVANYFAVTGTGVQTAGASQTITVTAYDYWNNVATGYQGAKDVTFSGASDSPDSPKAAVSPTVESIDFGTATTMTFNSGVSTGLMVLTKVETAEVKASENAIVTPDEYDLDVVVSHAANNYFAVTGASTQTAGVSQNITVTMYDAYNNIATSYDGDKLLTFSGANPSLYGNIPEVISTDFGTETTVTFNNGIANNVAMVLYDAADELQDALVGVTNGTETAAGLELAVNVEYNTATNLRVDTVPSTYVRAGELLEQQPVVSIRDAYGNLVDDNSTVVSATANGADVLQGTTDLTAENGIIAYTDLSYELMETITIDFDASPVLTPVTSGSVTVDHNATAKLVYSTIPDYIYAGGQRGAYTVERYDAYDNLVNNVVNPDGSDASSDETVYLYSADSDVSTKFYDVATGGNSVTAVAILNNQTSADFWYYSQVEGHHLITASDKSSLDDPDVDVQNATDILEVKPAALSHFIVSGVGTDVGDGWTEHYYGDRQTVTVEAIDIFGNRKINYNGSITFSLTDQEANEPADAGNNYPEDYTFTALDSGIHTFTNAILFERPSFEHPDYPNVNEWWVTVVDLAQPSKYGSQVKIKVLARPITITAINKTKQYYGDVYDLGSTEFTVTSGYGNPEIYAGDDSITNVTLISAGTASAATVGDYNIVPSNATGINGIDTSYYEITYAVGTLTVEPRPITITVDAGQSKTYGDADPAGYNYTVSSGNITSWDSFTGNLTRQAGEDVALYDVYLTGLGIEEEGADKSVNYDITFVNDNQFEITQLDVTVTADADQSKTYGDLDPELTFVSSPVVGAELANAEVIGFSGTLDRIAGEDVGFYHIGQGSLDNSNYNITYELDSLEITQLDVTVTADADQSKTYGDLDPELTFVSSPVVGAELANAEVIGFSGSLDRVAGEDVGFYHIGQGSLDNSNYNITFELDSLEITQLDVTVTADADQSKTYGDLDPELTFVSSPAVGVELTNAEVIGFSGTLDRVAGEDVGFYHIGQGSLDNSNYNITYELDSLEITQLDVTVTADADQSKTYGDLDPELTFVSSPVVGAELANAEVIGFSGTLDRVAGEDVGFYHIGQGSLDNSNYNITFELDSLEITQLDVTVTADADQSKTYGDLDPELTFVSSPVVGAELANAEVIGFSGTLDRVAGEDVGFYHIGQGSLDNSNYNITFELDSLEITQLDVTVTADADQSKTYGDLDPELTFVSSPVVGAELANAEVIGFSGSLDRVAGEDVGFYHIGQGSLDNSNYNITFELDSLEITQLDVTVTADADQSKTYGELDPELTFVSSPVVGAELANAEVIGFSGSLDRVAGEDVGFYHIGQGSLYNSNYNITFKLDSLEITQLDVTVTADADQSKTYGDLDPELTFVSSPVVGAELANAEVIGFSGSLDRVAGEDVGFYHIGQGSLDNSNYNITFELDSLEITQLDVTVTADADQSKTYGDLDPELTFVSSPVVGAELANAEVIGFSGSLDRVAGEDVGFYHIGQGSLDNSNYNITFELDSLEITQLDVTVTADADQSKTYGDLDPELTFVSSPVVGAELANAEVIGFIGTLDRVAGEDVGFYHIGQGSLDNLNYNITFELDSLEITQLDVTVTADADQSKTYGELDPEFTWTSYPAVDSVLANNSVIGFTGGLGRVAGEDVGSYAYTLGTLVNTNYNITLTNADFEITKRAITLVANDQVKTYGNGPEAGIGHADYWTLGTTEYTVSTTEGDGVATGETIDGVTFTSAGEARLADIGTYTISIDANSESGSGGFKLSNYDVSYDDATLTVEKRILHLSNFAADNKLYDGTTVATGLGFDDDRVPGDNLSFQRDADFEDANVGTEKVVIYNSVIISGGADINNYVLETNTDHWKTGPNRVISAAPITVSIVAEDKEYDGNTDATVTLSGNFLAGDDVQLTYVSALFDDAEIGDGKTVTVTGIALTGSDAGQYNLASTSGSATASIVNLQREQNLGLTAGWNLISVGLRPNGSMKLIDVLQPLIDDGTLLKVMDEQGRTIENLGGDTWFESIGDLLFTEGYQLKVSENTSLLVEGIPVELPMDIELVQGWNMISFPALNEQDAMEVLQALIDNGYLLKAMDEKGSSIEELAGSWYNFIGNFVPGKGYKVKVSQACTLTINEVSTKSLTTVPGLLASSSFSPVFTGNGFNHMNIVLAELYQKGIKTGDEIGIFDGDLCVGSVTIDDYNYLNNMISIPVSSNDGMTRDANGFIAGNRYSISILRNGEKQEVEFDIISGPEQFVVGATSVVALSSELGIGDVDERNSNVYGVKLYPNPFTTMMVIEVVQPEGDDLEIDIYDIQGRKVKTIEYGISTGHDKVRWDGNNQSGESVKPGLYYIRVNGKYSGNVLKQ
ncbi:MBG domain-containing protein [uncultured Draconibacterium sp.]|uniref:MBG domain-containing protein n=1 Tax=uncultured Draconibacterium sp. TaxID=1573823 RepID=UPI002AA70E86|nr:MBG domain-containing protein [uncultured Draconibacterium sp.]